MSRDLAPTNLVAGWTPLQRATLSEDPLLWNPEPRQCCTLDFGSVLYQPCAEALKIHPELAGRHTAGGPPADTEMMEPEIWQDLPRSLLDILIQSRSGKALVQCRLLDKSFNNQLTNSITPAPAGVAAAAPVLLTSGKPSWFGAKARMRRIRGWEKMHWETLALPGTTTQLSLLGCSKGLLLCGYLDPAVRHRGKVMLKAINPATREEVKLGVLEAVVQGRDDLRLESSLEILDVGVQSTFFTVQGQDEEGAPAVHTMVTLDLFLTLYVQCGPIPNCAVDPGGKVQQIMHVKYSDGKLQLRSCSPPCSANRPYLSGILWFCDPRALVHPVLAKAFVGDGRFFIMIDNKHGGEFGRGPARGDLPVYPDYSLMECDYRNKASVWRDIRLEPQARDQAVVELTGGRNTRKVALIGWNDKLALVEVIFGELLQTSGSGSSKSKKDKKYGIVRISLLYLEEIEGTGVHRWVPVPDLNQYDGDEADISSRLGYLIKMYVTGMTLPEDLAVSVVTKGQDMFVSVCFQHWDIWKHEMSMDPAEVFYYRGSDHVWLVSPPNIHVVNDDTACNFRVRPAQPAELFPRTVEMGASRRFFINTHQAYSFELSFARLKRPMQAKLKEASKRALML